MSKTVVLVDCGIGNINSVKNLLKKVGVKHVAISNSPTEIEDAQMLILPGVGSFDYGMFKLREGNLIETLNKKVLVDKVPVLGICLGAQILTKSSEEGELPGLGWIDAKTIKFRYNPNSEHIKIPHMGWNEVALSKESRLMEGMPLESRFYFVHSYHILCHNQSDELLKATHGYSFTAAVERDNIVGVQFHPEKSHKFGMRLLYNFINNY
jgi:glutamine amidotransferase